MENGKSVSDMLEQLNEAQRRAVVYNEGPQLVIAGAGSGKTRVLTTKIAYLIAEGTKPWNILALTFTNKAANEMKQRIADMVGWEQAHYIRMGTFHSVFARVLKIEAEQLGFNSSFTIYDEQDSRSLIKSIVKEMGLDDKTYKPAAIHNRISRAKNQLVTAEMYAADRSAIAYDTEAKMPELSTIFTNYARRCRDANAMDFDDLLLNTYILFRDHEPIRQKYAAQFSRVLVDEYQDTNYAQQCIIVQLSREHRQVCVVGDDAQSIYAFRGANIDNILGFQHIFPETKLFKLEQNYRSTQHIVLAANSLIKKNERQIEKDVYSRKEVGDKLSLRATYSDKEEAMVVCKEITRLRRADRCNYSDFAVLYRTNAQSRTFEDEMRKQNIPYRIYGGLSFYQRKEIKDVLAYFRLTVNPDDEEAFKRIINYPTRGIGSTSQERIAAAALDQGISFWQAALNMTSGSAGKKIADFCNLIQSFMSVASNLDAYDLGTAIIKQSGISADIYSGNDADSLSRQENITELMNSLQDFVETRREEGLGDSVSLAEYLQEVALLTDIESDDNSSSRVSLMTIHSAKGLEFPTVFIVGLEENIFPSQMSYGSARELEEERRLLYVAITRAQKHCIMTYARNRWRYGQMVMNPPSRFIKDIDRDLLEVSNDDKFQQFKDHSSQFTVRGGSGNNSPFSFRREVGGEAGESTRRYQSHQQPRITREPASDGRKLVFMGRRSKEEPEARSQALSTRNNQPNEYGLHEGDSVEHQRFGLGKVMLIEGTGENTKATVEFKFAGRKVLLLKFAKLKKL